MPSFWVNGIVSQRDGQPYIQLSNDKGMIGQFTMAIFLASAMDILQMSARTEADAMLVKFFRAKEYPSGAAEAILTDFRDFRAALDREKVDRGEEP